MKLLTVNMKLSLELAVKNNNDVAVGPITDKVQVT